MPELDRAKADLLSITPKVVNEDIVWRMEGVGYKLRAKVLAPDMKQVLEIRGYVGRTNRGFTLLFERVPIRRYDNQGRHTDPSGETVSGPHKHTWDRVLRDGDVYVPNDIVSDADPNDQFLQFLEEQNIRLAGNYQYMIFGTD